ncbi:MAG: hypothetical protein ACTH2U_02285 [Brevibacterium sp.]
MKTCARIVSTVAALAVLALGGCASDDGSDQDDVSGQTAEIPSGDFASTQDMEDFLTNSIDDVDVHRESETNPDFDAAKDADRLHVEFPSAGKKGAGQKASADAVQASGAATFDYDVLMITGTTDTGTWSYMYSSDTVAELTADDAVVEADSVWEHADQDFDSVHR